MKKLSLSIVLFLCVCFMFAEEIFTVTGDTILDAGDKGNYSTTELEYPYVMLIPLSLGFESDSFVTEKSGFGFAAGFSMSVIQMSYYGYKNKAYETLGFADQMFAGLAYRAVFEDGRFAQFCLYPLYSLNFIGMLFDDYDAAYSGNRNTSAESSNEDNDGLSGVKQFRQKFGAGLSFFFNFGNRIVYGPVVKIHYFFGENDGHRTERDSAMQAVIGFRFGFKNYSGY